MAKAKTAAPKIDVYERVTNAIVAQLEQGVRPWSKPWTVSGANAVTLPLRFNGKPYRGINIFLLWSDAISKGFTSPYWLTYNQVEALAKEKRAKLEKQDAPKITVEFTNAAGEVTGSKQDYADLPHVKRGEKGSFVIFANRIEKPSKADPSKNESIFFMKGYTVFNADQCENLADKFYPAKAAPKTEAENATAKAARIEHAESFLAKVGATVRHGGDRAFFSRSGDFIQLPEFDAFKDAESYYATSGHEHVHWTGATTRLNREFGKRFGDNAYAAEELVAEIGAAFLCAELGITLNIRDDHASYVANWLEVLKDDKRFIVQAASAAQKAVEYLKEAAGEGQKADGEESEAALAEAA